MSRLSPDTGKTIWTRTDDHAEVVGWWQDGVLVSGGRWTRTLRCETGEVISSKDGVIGAIDVFVVGAIGVGYVPEGLRAIDLETGRVLWQSPVGHRSSPASDGQVVVALGDDLKALDLSTGRVRWHRTKADYENLEAIGLGSGCIWRDRYIAFLGSHLTALDLSKGNVVWRWQPDGAVVSWQAYGGRGYCFIYPGRYKVVDLENGRLIFERYLGAHVPEPVRGSKRGLMVGTRGRDPAEWRGSITVGETHAFIANRSGQIVVLNRETADIVQIMEIDGMPASEVVIYENRLFITDFNADVYCFEGAS